MRAVLERYRVFWWLRRRATRLVMLILVVAVLFSAPVSERYGDRLQIALPVAGLVCTVLTGGAGEYLIRFAVLEVLLHGSKQGLGAAAINRRPDGGLEGFPSGHTAAAAFGASGLVHDCIRASAPARAVVLIAAFGVLDETVQTMTPGRTGGDLRDWIADVIGAVIGALLSLTTHRRICRDGDRLV